MLSKPTFFSMSVIARFGWIICLIALAGCSAAISVRSRPPEAEVGIILPNKDVPKILGKTPFDQSLAEISEAVDAGTVVLVVQKDGYSSQRFVIPNLRMTSIQLEANLVPNLKSDYEETNKIISMILKGERLLLKKETKKARDLADDVLKINNNIASAYQILGSAHFLDKDYKNAREAWIRAVELSPQNHEAKVFLRKLDELIGSTKPPADIGNDAEKEVTR